MVWVWVGSVLFLVYTLPLVGQTVLDLPVTERVSLALANPEYPLTPGDRFQILYTQNGTLQTLLIVVNADYQVSLGAFGSLNARHLTLADFRRQVQELFQTFSPSSTPIVEFISPGLFTFQLRGEVLIEIDDRESNRQVFDLYLAKRKGRIDQDPYIKAGDRITLRRVQKEVILQGEVRRPGTYQLLPSDKLVHLIEGYGDGLTPLADRTQIIIERPISPTAPLGQMYYINISDPSQWQTLELQNLDRVTITSVLEKRAVVFFEGAVNPNIGVPTPPTEYEVTNRIRYSLTPGITMVLGIIVIFGF